MPEGRRRCQAILLPIFFSSIANFGSHLCAEDPLIIQPAADKPSMAGGVSPQRNGKLAPLKTGLKNNPNWRP